MDETDSAISDAPDAPDEAAPDSEPAEEASPQPEATEVAGASGDAQDGGEGGDAVDGAEAQGGSDSEEPVKAPAKKPDPVAALQLDRDRIKQQLMRTAADFDNFRRRSRREVDDARMRGRDDAVLEFLPIMDNLERAVAAAAQADDVESVVSGVKMVLKLFEDSATRMGLNRVPSVGARFDPAMHDAIQHQESEEHPPGSIMAEVAAGYMFGKRLIRPAMVVVARAAAPPAKPEPEPEPEAEQAEDGAQATGDASEASGAAAKSEPPQTDTDSPAGAEADIDEGTDA